MKRIFLITLLTLFTIAGFSQSNGTLKFLDIPVDGTESQFVAKLKAKGFSYSSETGTYKGQFNGSMVDVIVHTNHNIVDRVYVVFPDREEERIKVEFNTLLSQFQNNEKYMDVFFNEMIPKDEDISYEMLLNKKSYSASFAYIDPNRDPLDLENELLDMLTDLFTEDQITILRKYLIDAENLPEEDRNELIDKMKDEMINMMEKQYPDEESQYMFVVTLMNGVKSIADGEVWFIINEFKGYYYIGLYYDNLHNRPHGEDL